jgi:hypothetical protein
MPDPIFLIDIGPDGTVASHPPQVDLPVLVAPVPDEQKDKNFNTVRPPLVAIGCFKLPKTGFAFDVSFIAPESEGGFTKFAAFMQALQKQDDQTPQRFPPVSIFGHADPTGTDEYNKKLAGRRALSVYGVLIRDVDLWDELFLDSINGGDRWGIKAIQTMLSVSLKRGPDGEPVDPPEDPFYTGPIDGAKTADTKKQTKQAVLDYEASRNLPQGFPPSTGVRKKMYAEYMDVICHDASLGKNAAGKSIGKRFKLNAQTDFLAHNADGKKLKGDVQGCGDFNPTFRLSQGKEDLAKNDKVLAEVRNSLYVVDRRVIAYIFRHGTRIDPKHWPCPRAREGPTDCTKRFWSDGDKRRKPGPDDRTFGENMVILELDDANNLTVHPVEETGNLMACRFYHAFAIHSPCETKLKEWVIRFKITSFNGELKVLSFRRYVVKAGQTENSPILRGTTDEFGVIRIPVFDEKTTMTLQIDAGRDLTEEDDNPPKDPPDPADEANFLQFDLAAGTLHPRDIDDDLAVKQRLYNLGFGETAPDKMSDDEFKKAFGSFQHKNTMDSKTDNEVRREIMKQHDLVGIPSPPPDDDTTAAAAGDPEPASDDSADSSI